MARGFQQDATGAWVPFDDDFTAPVKTVGDLFHSLNRDEVIASIGRLYASQPGAWPEGYEQAWGIILAMQASAPTAMRCELYRDDWPDGERAIGVHGREGREKTTYAIEYSPWAEWLAMEIVLEPDVGEISEVEILAHIFWEMTWAGYDDQEIQAQFTDILDRADDAKEAFEKERP
jgi:hypothetical protein